MRIVIDHDRCMGHGQCELIAPELFKLDENGLVQLVMENPPEAMREKAEDAARRCPEAVIQIED
jgi:ferredoxin